MTIQENAKFTCERLVQEYIENGSFKGMNDFWDTLAIIKHSLEINAITKEMLKDIVIIYMSHLTK